MRTLIVALSLGLALAACGKKGDPKPPSAQPAAETTADADSDTKKKTQ